MKAKVLLILGCAAWLGIATAVVINTYDNNQQAQAVESWNQAKAVQETQQQAKAQDQANKQTIQSLQGKVAKTNKDKNEACEALNQVQVQLTNYRITLTVPMPKGCR